MFSTRRPLGFIVIAALGSACAPQRPMPGTLAPVQARTTNERRAADLVAIDRLEARRVALLRNDGADLPGRAVALARAGAWIALAREAYVARPMTRDADDALAEARKLMAPFDHNVDATAARTVLATRADRTSPDNWAEVERLAAKPASVANAASLAEAEIELVRAGAPATTAPAQDVVLAGGAHEPVTSAVVLPTSISETSVSPLSCPAVQHIARAAALLALVGLVQQGDARELSESDRMRADARLRTRRVHFAVRSDVVGLPSAALLSGVADALKSYPELSLAIEGYTDPRGTEDANRELSGRRAGMVRDILADSGVAEDRMLVRQFGERNRASTGTTALDYARDRRVQLKFVLQNGEELPITEDDALDLQIERVVKRSAAVRRARAKSAPQRIVRRVVPEPLDERPR